MSLHQIRTSKFWAAAHKSVPCKGRVSSWSLAPCWSSNLIAACSHWSQVLAASANKHNSVSAQHLMTAASTRKGTFLLTFHRELWEPVEHWRGKRTHEPPGLRLISGSFFIWAVMVRLYFSLWMGALLQLCHATIYTNDWAIRIRGDPESVDRIAHKYGFTNMGQVRVVQHRHVSNIDLGRVSPFNSSLCQSDQMCKKQKWTNCRACTKCGVKSWRTVSYPFTRQILK